MLFVTNAANGCITNTLQIAPVTAIIRMGYEKKITPEASEASLLLLGAQHA